MIRQATLNDKNEVLAIYASATSYIHSYGSPQWQNGTGPNNETFLRDVSNNALYVLIEENKIVAVTSIFNYEPTYDVIDGAWPTDGPYFAMHRIAKASNRKGKKDIEQFFSYIKNELNGVRIRIDTHHLNTNMKNLLLRNGFIYAGVISLNQEQDKERLAYQLDFN